MPKKIFKFLSEDLWRIRLAEQPCRRSLWIKLLRIIVLSIKGFDRNKCTLRASALTFYTLLSIVPILAMAFGIAKGFGFDQILEQRIREQFQGQEEAFAHAITFARNLLENTKGGLIAGIGVVFLFWSVIKVLGNMERSFNDIWRIKKQRTWMRKFSDYLSFMLISPVLFIMASSMTIMVTSKIKDFLLDYSFLSFMSGPVLILLRLLPFAVLWGLFAFVYVFVPNGKINIRSAVIGGILAGSIYQLVQWAYIASQIGINRYNAIYGSFAALPLFLVWLQLSWLILLYGAEVSFAHQNVGTYEFEQDCSKINASFRRLVALAISHLCVKAFHQESPPQTAEEISHTLETPIRLVNEVLYDLTEAGILSEVAGNEEGGISYQPALELEDLTLQNVVDRLDKKGIDNLPLAKSGAVEKLSECLAGFRDTMINSPSNIRLKDL